MQSPFPPLQSGRTAASVNAVFDAQDNPSGTMLDRSTFLRPIAHRGLHNAKTGIVENSVPAFEAAIAQGYGIECDLRPASGGVPLVFHDETTGRLTNTRASVADLTAADIKRIAYRDSSTRISTFAALLVEIKSEWNLPDRGFLTEVARLSAAYRGPIALMSFDPDVMAAIRELAPGVPRGLVSGSYAGAGWWSRKLTRTRAAKLRDLLESAPAAPDFYAYQVSALPTAVTEFTRSVLGLPLFTWTVRTARDRAIAAKWADAPIFEGAAPSSGS